MPKRPWPLHPLLFAAMPIATLYASNLGQVAPDQVLRPLALSLVGTLLLFGLLQLVFREWHIAALLSSGIVFGFFSYGHVHVVVLTVTYTVLDRLADVSVETLKVMLHPVMVAGWVAALLLVMRLVQRRSQWQAANLILNSIGVVLLLIPLGQILVFELQLRGVQTADSPESPNAAISEGSDRPPDIYYIVLDGYAGQATLREVYGYDNSEFLDFLRSLGFYVAADSKSNYVQTILSLCSSMNMAYLSQFIESGQVEQVNQLIPLLRHSELRSFLQRKGYSVVSFSSGYFRTTISDSDVFLEPQVAGAKDLEALLIQTTALYVVQDAASLLGLPFPYPGYEAHRERILFTLEQLPSVPEIPGPKFVFVHLLIPHPPFVFGASGEPHTVDRRFAIGDGSDFAGTTAEYLRGYRDQVRFVNRRLMESLPAIISQSSPEPVIIVQGDHGPGSSLDWSFPEESALRERFSILNAIRLPGVETDVLYPTMTPVNTFRVILNSYFGAGLSLLPDRSFYSHPKRPLEWTPLEELASTFP